MSFSHGGVLRGNSISPAHIASLVAGAGLAIVAYLLHWEIKSKTPVDDDAGWAMFDISYEHQRLQVAAERGQSLPEVKLRGDIYLSRVNILRDAPMMAELRARANPDSLRRLFQSVQATERLIADLGNPDMRDALLRRLRADTRLVREVAVEFAQIAQRIESEYSAQKNRRSLVEYVVLGVLMLVMLGLSIVAVRLTRKLRQTGCALATQSATQDAILRSVDDAILVLGHQGNVLYSNPHALALLGLSAARGSRLPERSRACGLAGDIAALLGEAQGPESGAPLMRKVTAQTRDGTRYHVIRVFPPAVAPGAPPGNAAHVVAISDVTTEEEAAQRREEYGAGLVEASRLLALAAISGGIVHEISQPLAAIRNYVYALKVYLSMKPGSEEQRIITERMGEEIERAIEVVRNVRRLGPQDSQDTGACDLQEAIVHSVRLVSIGANPPPSITIHAPAPGTRITGSLPMIGQVIVNLLSNALSASVQAGRAGAEVSVRQEDGFASITVTDFGNGVSPEAARTLFSPFSKSGRGGMGLGLAICQRLAASLGGSLSWENRKGGASFTFTVPLAKDTR